MLLPSLSLSLLLSATASTRWNGLKPCESRSKDAALLREDRTAAAELTIDAALPSRTGRVPLVAAVGVAAADELRGARGCTRIAGRPRGVAAVQGTHGGASSSKRGCGGASKKGVSALTCRNVHCMPKRHPEGELLKLVHLRGSGGPASSWARPARPSTLNTCRR